MTKAEMTENLKYFSEKLTALHGQAGLNPDFWKVQTTRLGPSTLEPSISATGACSIGQRFANEYWYLDSKTFENSMGLKFEGDLCADDPECSRHRILLFVNLKRSICLRLEQSRYQPIR